jgi:pSer/pThr/pTyr-binding forkhead associated (FHA) protein
MTAGARAAWLVDERWAKAYPLGEVTTIGRGSENMIILRDPAVSRLHAEVRKEPGDTGGWILGAHGATGTKVNGLPVGGECRLAEGDVVEIAFSRLRFTTKAPTEEMFVIPRDTPSPLDAYEGPTRTTTAVNPAAILGASRRSWRRIWYWLTHRSNTD